MRAALAVASVLAMAAVVAGQPQSQFRLYAGPAGASLVTQGLLPAAPSDVSSFHVVPAPGLRTVRNDAQATVAPWVDSNGWRFQRGLTRVSYEKLPAGASLVAAAEAFAFGVEAILNPDAADLEELGRLLALLKAHSRPVQPAIANVGVVDDGTPQMGEVLNLLTRRNLLYRVVPSGDRSLAVTVEAGTPGFPRDSLTNPNDFAARVRETLGDDRRSLRLYGTSTVIARLTGDEARLRLHLVSYSRNRNQPAIRVRVLGAHQPALVAAFGAAADAGLVDVRHPDGGATEFSVPAFNTVAIVDLNRLR
jgi:hypothetical protein